MNMLIFIGILTIVGGIILRLMNETPLLDMLFVVVGTIMFFFGLFITDTPTAMDVYQGKTILEITYKDGDAVDSVVVFKDKKK